MSNELSEKQIALLRKLYENSRPLKVRTVAKKQVELANELGITRQALNNHLRRLREEGYIRTGRGFIDLTDKALTILGKKEGTAFVLIDCQPKFRDLIYEKIKKMNVRRVSRVTGDVDIIVEVNREELSDFLKEVSKLEGVEETKAHVVLEVYER